MHLIYDLILWCDETKNKRHTNTRMCLRHTYPYFVFVCAPPGNSLERSQENLRKSQRWKCQKALESSLRGTQRPMRTHDECQVLFGSWVQVQKKDVRYAHHSRLRASFLVRGRSIFCALWAAIWYMIGCMNVRFAYMHVITRLHQTTKLRFYVLLVCSPVMYLDCKCCKQS